MGRSLVLAVLGLALVSCRARAPKESTALPPPAVEPAGVAHAPDQAARRIALAPPGGTEPVDRQITSAAKLAAAQPRKLEPWLSLGRAWVSKARVQNDPGYYLNASACADVALELAPGAGQALDLRALVWLSDHRFREVKDLARSMVERDPEAPMAWGSLSDALLELGEIAEADEAAQKMMELKPNLPSYSRVSYLQWLRGDVRGAIESARLAIDAGHDPRNPEPLAWQLVQTAMLFWHEGDREGADAGFETALKALPDYAPALVGRGRVAMARGDAARAALLFQQAYRLSPLTETAWLLADARELEGDGAGASEALALAEKQGRAGDRRTLSLLYSERGDRAVEALRLAEQEKAVRGGVYTDDALAWAYYRNRMFPQAKAAIDRARSYGTRDARLLYHQGAIEIGSGQIEAGKRRLADVIARHPELDARSAAEARALLAAK